MESNSPSIEGDGNQSKNELDHPLSSLKENGDFVEACHMGNQHSLDMTADDTGSREDDTKTSNACDTLKEGNSCEEVSKASEEDKKLDNQSQDLEAKNGEEIETIVKNGKEEIPEKNTDSIDCQESKNYDNCTEEKMLPETGSNSLNSSLPESSDCGEHTIASVNTLEAINENMSADRSTISEEQLEVENRTGEVDSDKESEAKENKSIVNDSVTNTIATSFENSGTEINDSSDSTDLEKCEMKDKTSDGWNSIPADQKFDNTTCDLLVFDMKENKEKPKVLTQVIEGSADCKNDINCTSNGVYIQPVFEDITEDEDSDEEQFENIELELDDLIDTPDASLNSSGNSARSGNGDSALLKEDATKPSATVTSENNLSGSVESNDEKIKIIENINGVTATKSNEMHKSCENIDPTGVISEIQLKSSKGKPLVKKKSTARKSGKPVSQLESAPLKRINMYPITDVTMSISEVEEALKFDFDQAKKVKKSDNTQVISSVDPSQGNTYKVISVTKSNPGMAMKKKRKKRGYDLPGCKRKKKFKLSDDVGSVGASSVDSISLSESDLMESDSISSCSSTHLSTLPESHGGSSRESVTCTTTSSSLSVSSSSVSVLSSSFSSSVVSSASSNTSSYHAKPGNNKGSSKMKSVLEMLHERNKHKTVTDVDGRLGSVGKETVTTSTTTTTTTIMVSPPASKPIIEGVKRKGTPRKRRDDVICLSDDDDVMEMPPKGKRNSSDHVDIGINTTTTSMIPTKIPTNLSNGATSSSGPAPVIMMVAQHSNSPGLRSLLPRNMLVSASPVSGNPMAMTMIRPENVLPGVATAPPSSNILTPLPLVSTLPVGMKAVSVANLPGGLSAIPITSLPLGSTIFTAVQGNNQSSVANPLPGGGTTFFNITPPKGITTVGLTNNNNNNNNLSLPLANHHPPSLISSSLSTPPKAFSKSKQQNLLTSPQQKNGPPQVNSESLRALLVGKPYSIANPNITPSQVPSLMTSLPYSTISTPSSLVTNSPVVFQMLNSKTSLTNSSLASFVPLQSATTTSQKTLVKSSLASHANNKSSLPAVHTYSAIKPIHHSIMPPNGVSCLTPPKTPDTDSSSEVAVAASLTRPVGGQFEDNDVIPLCCCKINVPSFNKMLTGVTYCQALDSVDNKVLGCCNKVTNNQLVRPGVKIPFMAVCEVHRKRLAMHQCCPGCGHFCSQGKFQQCRKEGTASTHQFHKQCMFYRGGKHFCPHCGEETSQCEVELKLNDDGSASSNRLTGKGAKKKDAEKKVSARLGVGCKKSKSTSNKENKTLTLPNKKTVDSSALSSGPDLATLTRLCKSLGEDRPKKYRTLPKDLYTPASEGDMEKVFYLLADGMDPNVRREDHDDQTPLHAAAISGSLGTVFILENFGAELHAQDKSLQTPLMCAAENGHVTVVQYLLKAGAKVEDRGEDGMTGLHYAAKAGHLDIIKLLLNTKKLDINVQDDGGWTPIIWATESMLPDIVKYLIGQGGDPNQKDNEENTGLHWAAFSGSLEIAEMLLDLGCELDTPNEHGDRPLHIAARQDHYDIVVHLLAKGANVDVKNNKNETPVEACVNKTGQVSMALKVNQQLRGLATYKLIQPERLLDRDITMGREKNPVACVNKEDNEPCPTDYLYVMQNVETSPLNINGVITGLQSCRCKDDCSSMYCVCARSSVHCWYDKAGRLVEDFNLLEPPLLFECNRACRCWVNCNNRVVQNGIVCRLQLFRTNGRGWGVRALMDIPKGTFVCEYVGELISDSEADRREDDSYLFDLDNKDGDTYCIDARKYGNVARFINHLCEPNLVPVKVFVEHQDLRFPRICFFSSREIKAYEELGFDYGEKFWIIKWKQFTCACQSEKCKYSKDTIQKTLEDYKARYPDETTDQDNS